MKQLSPNQLAKREQIVAAAQRVILREGPVACTTREVARESQINKGLIYYYFDSQQQIIDTAMADFAEQIAGAITRAKNEHEDPTERFWAVFENYLGLYKTPGLNAAWFEYVMVCNRSGRVDMVERVRDIVLQALTKALQEAGADDSSVRARVTLSYIIGVLVRSFASPLDVAELRPEIMYLAASPALSPHVGKEGVFG